MPLVNVMVNGKAYTLGCADGEEDHLRALAGMVDEKVREAQNMVGLNANDTKLMLTAALLIADEHHAAVTRLENSARVAGDLTDLRSGLQARVAEAEGFAAETLEAAAKRIEAVAQRLVDA